mgnify:CR=1 FL=1
MSAMPSGLRYETLPPSINARTKTVQFTPDNGNTFSLSTTSVIRLPIRASQGWLDGRHSALRFTLTNTLVLVSSLTKLVLPFSGV